LPNTSDEVSSMPLEFYDRRGILFETVSPMSKAPCHTIPEYCAPGAGGRF
jgi:hypothetical protein